MFFTFQIHASNYRGDAGDGLICQDQGDNEDDNSRRKQINIRNQFVAKDFPVFPSECITMDTMETLLLSEKTGVFGLIYIFVSFLN